MCALVKCGPGVNGVVWKRGLTMTGDENVLICGQPMLLKACQDSRAPNRILWTSHCSIPCIKKAEGYQDGVKPAMGCLRDVCRNRKWLKVSFHPSIVNNQILDGEVTSTLGRDIHSECIPKILILDYIHHLPCLCFSFGIPCNDTLLSSWLLFINLNDNDNDGMKFSEPTI